MRRPALIFFISLLPVITCLAQRPPAISSPEVQRDDKITFRYFSRTAKTVWLSGEFLTANQPMTRDSSGIWSITVGPVNPDIYPYFYVVDSIQVADPNNTRIFANERFKRSIVEIDNDRSLVHSLQNVPHGKITYCYYTSGTLKSTRRLLVYTPPGFNPIVKTRYPVLYLVHGGSDTEETWTKVGHANLIADNLIAQGKAKPMIIVMPYGNVRPAPMADFTSDVVDDIVPFIEKTYPVLPGSSNRAIAGFSVGGGQTLNIGLTNPDKFAFVFAYAPYTATEEFKKNFSYWSPNAIKMNSQLKLFTVSVGTEDFLFQNVKDNIAMFQQKNIKLKKNIVPGGHTWMNCKLYLTTSLQEVFK